MKNTFLTLSFFTEMSLRHYWKRNNFTYYVKKIWHRAFWWNAPPDTQVHVNALFAAFVESLCSLTQNQSGKLWLLKATQTIVCVSCDCFIWSCFCKNNLYLVFDLGLFWKHSLCDRSNQSDHLIRLCHPRLPSCADRPVEQIVSSNYWVLI